jgi:protein transport protein SEC24
MSSLPPDVIPVDPRFLAVSTQCLPSGIALQQKMRMPLSVVVQPLAETGAALPVVNFGNVGVIRCTGCRAYLSPYVHFYDNGARWKCNLCGLANETPQAYQAPLDQNGRRTDMFERAELHQPSIEIVAPSEYMMRPPMPPVFVFAIDVSARSVQNGALAAVAQSIQASLDLLPGDGRTQVGFITFDSTVHCYSLAAGAKAPRMLVLPDLGDLFLPAPSDLLVNLQESRPQIDALLSALPTIHASTQNVESAMGAAVMAATILMKDIGGKLMVFTANLPSVGPGRLQNRDAPRMQGTPKENTLLQPTDRFYLDRAHELIKIQARALCARVLLEGGNARVVRICARGCRRVRAGLPREEPFTVLLRRPPRTSSYSQTTTLTWRRSLR